jgi:hypothetical protein
MFSFMWQTTVAYTIVMGVVGLEADEEKRTRYNALLPVRPRQLALLDLAYVTLPHLGMVALWFALLPFKPRYAAAATTYWAMASHSGLTLGLMALFIIHTHLGFFGDRRYRRIDYALLLTFGAAIASLVYTGWMGAVRRALFRHYASWTGALSATLLWLLLSWLSVVLYERRRSYLA